MQQHEDCHRTPSAAASTFGKVQVGDTVEIETQDGKRARSVVAQIDGDTLVSREGIRYAQRDIVQLQRRSFDGLRTAFLSAGIFVAWLAIFASAYVIAWQ